MSGRNSVKCTNKSKPGHLFMHLLRQRAQTFLHFFGLHCSTRLCLHTQQCHKGTLIAAPDSACTLSSVTRELCSPYCQCLPTSSPASNGRPFRASLDTRWDCTQRHCNTHAETQWSQTMQLYTLPHFAI